MTANAALPPFVENFTGVVNRGDSAAFLDLFLPDGAVVDWGRRFAGRKAIGEWNAKEMIGAKGTLTITSLISASPSQILVMTHWESNFFTGDSKFTFHLEGDRIREMVISEN
ncbi:MAG TPA: nuclear transport factor 2 family protein [Devosiaceae bacterium]|jgi:hypothetical protein